MAFLLSALGSVLALAGLALAALTGVGGRTLGSGAGRLVITSVSGQVTLLERNNSDAGPAQGGPETPEDAS